MSRENTGNFRANILYDTIMEGGMNRENTGNFHANILYDTTTVDTCHHIILVKTHRTYSAKREP